MTGRLPVREICTIALALSNADVLGTRLLGLGFAGRERVKFERDIGISARPVVGALRPKEWS